MSRILLYWILLTLFVLGSCQQEKEIVDSIFYGGDIITMNGDSPEYAGAVAVNDGQIIFVGSKKEAFNKYTSEKISDMDGKTLTPGFIEPHLHPSLAAIMLQNEIIAPYDWNIPSGIKEGVQTADGYLEQVRSSIEANAKEGELYFLWGYHQLWHGDLNRTMLNELAGDKPVAIIHRSFHEIFMNDAAIDLVGIKEEDFRDNPQVFWDKGHFYEGGMLAIAPILSQYLLEPKSYLAGLAGMTEILRKNGITTIAEPGFPSVDFDMELQMLRKEMEKQPPYDVYLIPNGTQLYAMRGGNQEALQFMESLDTIKTSDQLQFLPKQLKLFSDGAIYSQLMQMKDGYIDGHEGEWMTPLDLLKEQMQLYWDEGYKIHMHANGDLGQQQVIDYVREIRNKSPREDHRFTLHHMGYFTDEMAGEMAELGIEASVNPYYLWALADKYSEYGLGRERAENLVALKLLTDENIPLSFHSDFSMAPAEPLTLAWTAVNRVTSQKSKFSQEQRISVFNAMKAITLDAARCLNLESELGSLAVGKKANFTILEENPFKVDPLKIKDIKVIGVVYKGKTHLN